MNCLSLLIIGIAIIGSVYSQCDDTANFVSYTGAPNSTVKSYYNHKLKVTTAAGTFWYTFPYRIGVCNPGGYPTSTEKWVKYTCSSNNNYITQQKYTNSYCNVTDGSPMIYYSTNSTTSYLPGDFVCDGNKNTNQYFVALELAIQSDIKNLKCKVDNDTDPKSIDFQIMAGVCFKINDTARYTKIYGWKQKGKNPDDLFFGQVQFYYDTKCTNGSNNDKALVIEDMCDSTAILTHNNNTGFTATLAITNTNVSVNCEDNKPASAATFTAMFSIMFVAVIGWIMA